MSVPFATSAFRSAFDPKRTLGLQWFISQQFAAQQIPRFCRTILLQDRRASSEWLVCLPAVLVDISPK